MLTVENSVVILITSKSILLLLLRIEDQLWLTLLIEMKTKELSYNGKDIREKFSGLYTNITTQLHISQDCKVMPACNDKCLTGKVNYCDNT